MASDPTDRIGDRLDHPERVPPELRHLIADDQQRVTRILSIPVAGRVLDVGCSDGAITRRIAERPGVIGMIGSDVRCAEADWPRRGEDGRNERLRRYDYIVWDVRQPWSCEKYGWLLPFDAVYACEVLEHLTDADAQTALKHIVAVLKPSGHLIVTVPNRHPADLYEVGCRSRWAWPDHRSAWTFCKLGDWLGEYFGHVTFLPLYDGEAPAQSIWLIAHATERL